MPDDRVLMPREATPAMLAAVYSPPPHLRSDPRVIKGVEFGRVHLAQQYRVMVAAWEAEKAGSQPDSLPP